MARIAIVGATGYGGVELIRLLQGHPQAVISCVTSETYAGQRVDEVYPHLVGFDLTLQKLDAEATADCDFALTAVPAGVSMDLVPRLLDGGTRVVDISPDFRLKDASVYRRWYEREHQCPALLQEAVFGIPELHRESMRGARLVAAPGCYPTGALLALAPLVSDGLIDATDIIVDGKTGISGAGRTSLKLPYHFPEANEDVAAYSVGGHRHMPEMVQELSALSGSEVRVTFTPHLVPMTRGILLTAYVRPRPGVGMAALRQSLESRYADEPFTHVLPEGTWPHTAWTVGTNHCFLAAGLDEASQRGIVVSAVDNIGKGYAGQMVQCLNVMLGADETAGLRIPAAHP
jgi:N-acetyl-gamma-glutamyl-phosphate reductase